MKRRNAENTRLDSWKGIALYLNRTAKTCHRWSCDLGLPVYRVDEKSNRSRVFAFKSEIDEWFSSRRGQSTKRILTKRKGRVK